MIKMKTNKFMSFALTNAMQKLTSSTFNYQTSYKLKKIADAMNSMRKQLSSEYQALVKTYAKVDEKGNLIHPDADDKNSFDIDESKMEEYKKAEADFGEKEVIIARAPIHFSELGDLKLTPGEVTALESVVVGPEETSEVTSPTQNNVTPLHAG